MLDNFIFCEWVSDFRHRHTVYFTASVLFLGRVSRLHVRCPSSLYLGSRNLSRWSKLYYDGENPSALPDLDYNWKLWSIWGLKNTLNSSLSCGQAALTFCLPRATSCWFLLLILLENDLLLWFSDDFYFMLVYCNLLLDVFAIKFYFLLWILAHWASEL